MVSVGTKLFVSDNSGALVVKCIKILGSTKKIAKIGDILVFAVKKARAYRKIKKHDVRKGYLIRHRQRIVRKTGVIIYFFINAVIIMDMRGGPQASRIFGVAPQEFRGKRFLKLITLAHSVI